MLTNGSFAHLGVNSKPHFAHKDDFCSADLKGRASRGRRELKVCEGHLENTNINIVFFVGGAWGVADDWSPAEGTGHLQFHFCADILQDVDHVGIF